MVSAWFGFLLGRIEWIRIVDMELDGFGRRRGELSIQ